MPTRTATAFNVEIERPLCAAGRFTGVMVGPGPGTGENGGKLEFECACKTVAHIDQDRDAPSHPLTGI